MKENMTALISCFVRYYHTKNSNIKIYKDLYAEKLLTKEEIQEISTHMKEGISFFNPNYQGDNPLEWIMTNQLSPAVLARSAINLHHLLNEIRLGLKQYLVIGSGYDTSAYKVNKKIKVFELDKKELIEDKKKRVKKANIDTTNISYIKTDFNKDWIKDLLKSSFSNKEKTFCSLLGISYYLENEVFKKMIIQLSQIIPDGSVILFDYPNKLDQKSLTRKLAKEAHEEMKETYSRKEMEKLVEEANLLIYEHLNNQDVNKEYFYNYNTLNPMNKMLSPEGVDYVLLIKKSR